MKPVVLFSGPLTNKSLEYAWAEIKEYQARGETEVGLIIRSDGGSGSKALDFADKLRELGVQTWAKIYRAESAAAIIAMAADRREMTKDAVFGVHLGAIAHVETSDLGERGEIPTRLFLEAKRVREGTLALLAKVGLKAPSAVTDILLARNRLTLTAEECLKLGIVERIID